MNRFWLTRSLARTSQTPADRRGLLRFKPEMLSLESREVPATFYFDPTAVDNGSGNATFNNGLAGQHVGAFNPTVPVDGAVYNSLDQAVAAAGNASFPGRDTIRIAAGNITMTDPTLSPAPPPAPSGNTGDFSDLGGIDVLGSGLGVTVLRPNYSSSSPTAFGGVVNFFGGGNYTLGNLTINASGQSFATGVAVNDAGTTLTITNVQFTNIVFASNNTQFGTAVNVKNGAAVTVQNSAFTSIGQIGVSARDANTTITVAGNTYVGKGAGNGLDYFVAVVDGASALITGNRVTNNTGVNGSARSAAVIVQDSSEPGGAATARIYANSFGLLSTGAVQANDSGVIVGSSANDTSFADVRFNNIVGTFGISTNLSGSAACVTGFYNYWGNATGPTASANPGGTGSAASARVNIGPVRGGPITPTVGPDLDTILKSITPIGPTLAIGPGTGSGVSGAATTLALNDQGRFDTTPSQGTGARTAIGDVNGDGVNDIIVGSGPGVPGVVTVYDGKTQIQLLQFDVLDGFTGGVFVAAADFNRDGRAEIVAVPDAGGGPRVQIFDVSSGIPITIQSFYALDETLRTGLTVAVGDVDGDRIPDLVVMPGPGGGPRTAFFDGGSIYSVSEPVRLIGDLNLYDPSSRAGFYIALGDVNGDGFADVIVSSNTGGSTSVSIWSGRQLMNGTANAPLFQFFANPADDGQFTTGVRVAATDFDGDAREDLVTGDAAFDSAVRVFFGDTTSLTTGTADQTIDLLNIDVGVFVG